MVAGYILTRFPVKSSENETYEIKCTSFVLNDPDYGIMLFDTGYAVDTDRFLNILLNKFEIKAEQVNWVFTTHLHPDHMGAHAFFPNARMVYSKKDYMTIDGMAVVAKGDGDMLEYLHNTFPGYRNSITRFDAYNIKQNVKQYWPHILGSIEPLWIEDSPDIPPYISIWPTFGHTLYHYTYTIRIGEMEYHVTGDALSTRLLMDDRNLDIIMEPHMNHVAYEKSLKQCRKLRGIIIPGHDRPFDAQTRQPVMSRRFNPLNQERI